MELVGEPAWTSPWEPAGKLAGVLAEGTAGELALELPRVHPEGLGGGVAYCLGNTGLPGEEEEQGFYDGLASH